MTNIEKQITTFGMYELLAILGAMAWLPQIIVWIRNYFSKSKLSIISDKEIEIGYTSNGPIINIYLAFLSEEKKALIKSIEVELTHEKNDSHKFSWDWFEETLYAINVPNTGLMPTKKNQRAIAIKVDKDQLIEKKIGFQQNTFKSEHKQLLQTTTEEYLNLSNADQDTTALKGHKCYNDLLDFYKNSFAWKVGLYSAKVIVNISEDNKSFERVINFKLNSLDIKSLDFNIERCKLLAEQEYINGDLEIGGNWFWVYPSEIREN
jgi:hypothetical protein